ncbi:unnamed protein product, partial [Mesorhabditis spiculigera]
MLKNPARNGEELIVTGYRMFDVVKSEGNSGMAHAAEHAICLGLHRRKNIGTRTTPRGTIDLRIAEEYASALDAQTYKTVIRISTKKIACAPTVFDPF